MFSVLRRLPLVALLVLLAVVIAGSAQAADLPPTANIDGLIKALSSTDVEVRIDAARDLAEEGKKAHAAVPALVKALGDKEPRVRAYAANALGHIGDASPATVEALAARALDEDSTTRSAVLGALRNLHLPRNVSVPLFAKVLSHADTAHIQPALHSLANAGADAVPFLIDCLKDKQAAYWACLVLAEIGPDAKDAVPGLAELLQHATEPETRLHAAVALGEIGPAAVGASPALTRALSLDTMMGVRYAVAYALGKIGARQPEIENALLNATESQDKFLQAVSAWALAHIAPKDSAHVERAVKLLIAGLKSDDNHLRRAAARGLAELNVPADNVLPALIEALADPDPTVASNVLDGLASRGSAAVPRIIKALDNPATRMYAARLVARIGVEAQEAGPALAKALVGAEGEFRVELQFALGAIRAAGAPAVPELIKSLDSSDDMIRNSALFALGRIGPAAMAAEPVLEKMSKSEDPFVRMGSLWALVYVEPNDAGTIARAVPELIAGLSDERDPFRYEMAQTLGTLGAAAKSALPKLHKLAEEDVSPAVRSAAAHSIKQIEGK